MPGRHLVLYDGVCGLCNGIVRLVLRRDTAHAFDFASLQSAIGQSWLSRFGRNADALDTLVVISDYGSASPGVLVKARAALFIVGALGVPWSGLRVVGVLPTALLNALYDAIARRRYRLFGRYDTCPLPRPEDKPRFIDA